MRLRTLLLCVVLPIPLGMLACSSASNGDGAETEEADSALSAALIQNLGSISRGQTLSAGYTSTSKYRSYSFTAAAGDVVDFWVRSSNGGAAYAYILRSTFSTVTSNHDAPGTKDAHVQATIATAGTYYLVFRDEALHDATFTVEFNKPAVAVDAGTDAPACRSGVAGCGQAVTIAVAEHSWDGNVSNHG